MLNNIRLLLMSTIVGLMPVDMCAKTDIQVMDKQAEETKPFDNGEGDTSEDPFEPMNRLFFGINQHVDGVLIKPVAHVYDDITPEPVKKGVENFMDNIFFPIKFVNYLLQGRMTRAGESVVRFVVNTTVGLGGLLDPANELGFKPDTTGFGDTLTTWGMGPGPYFVMPIFGPSSIAHTVGFGMDYYLHPLALWSSNTKAYHKENKHHQYTNWWMAKNILEGISINAKYLKDERYLQEESSNYYEVRRSISKQQIKGKQEQIQKERFH
jgi:phospholipid-binding lipoprotein MlaA